MADTIDLTKLDEEPYLVTDRNILLLPTNGQFDRIIPDNTPVLAINGHSYYAVPNTPEFSAVLYQRGYPMPSPIYYSDYDWSGVKIFAAQAQMAGLLSARRRCFNLSALGTGKTIGSLLAIDYLMTEGRVRKALITAPLSVLWTVWHDEIKKHFPRLLPIVVHGTKKQRVNMLATKGWNVAIINHEGLKVALLEIITQGFELVVIDEVAMFRDHRTEKWKMMQQVIDKTTFAAGLTGSPTPNFPSDAYGIARLLVPERCPRSFRAFRQSVELQVSDYRWVPRKNATEIISRILQPAVRFKRSDVIELKDSFVQRRRVMLSDMQRDALETLKREAVAMFPEGVVTAVNAAVLVSKLLQICGGMVYTKTKAIVDLDPKHRLLTTKELVDAAEGKVIVVAPYKHVIAALTKYLSEHFRVAEITGAVDVKDRSSIIRQFQDTTHPLRVIVAHPKPLAHGINLTAADTIIWFLPIHSFELYEQANGRITRMGQNREQYIIHLSSGKEEDAVYSVIQGRGKMLNAVLDMFELRMQGLISDAHFDDPQLGLGI